MVSRVRLLAWQYAACAVFALVLWFIGSRGYWFDLRARSFLGGMALMALLVALDLYWLIRR